jgi:DNA repair exonuclease SbcCD nuclease subunit
MPLQGGVTKHVIASSFAIQIRIKETLQAYAYAMDARRGGANLRRGCEDRSIAMFRFIHAADIHLDSPLKGLERYEGAPVDRIRQATRRALENLVQLALDEKVQFVLIAGDLYDGDWKDYNTGLFLGRQLSRLRDAEVPVVLIAGNHDAENKMTRTLRLPDNVSLLSSASPETKTLEEIGVAIHGQSFPRAAEERDLSAQYPQAAQGLFNIGLLHTCATGASKHARYAPCTLEGLRSKGYDYWALGHVHERRTLHQDPHVIFPGNVQGRDIGEPGAKGCMLVTVDGRSVSAEFQSLDVLRWERCEVDTRGAENADAVMERVSHQLQRQLETSAERPMAVRVDISGLCPAHAQLQASAHKWTNEVRNVANEVGADQIWIEKVKLRTVPPQAEAADKSDGPTAELLDLLDHLRANDSQLACLHGELADLEKKLPPEVKEGPDALNLADPAWLRGVLDRVGPMLIDRLRTREGMR